MKIRFHQNTAKLSDKISFEIIQQIVLLVNIFKKINLSLDIY